MERSALEICLPYLGILGMLVVALRLIVRAGGGRLRLARLATLHRDEGGSVQTLSFVITLPLFVLFLMAILQVTQIMIGRVVVEYSAVAAARSATVWIPAYLAGTDEGRNRISSYFVAPFDVEGGRMYEIVPRGPKFERVHMAAAMACMPIAPSRDTGAAEGHPGFVVHDSVQAAYRAMAPGGDASIERRLRNKLAFALNNTYVRVRFFHKDTEPWFAQHDRPHDRNEFYYNEIGWQDSLEVTVYHRLAMIPGPARMFANMARTPEGFEDSGTSGLEEEDGEYFWPLSASAMQINEGQKPMIRYEHSTNGQPL